MCKQVKTYCHLDQAPQKREGTDLSMREAAGDLLSSHPSTDTDSLSGLPKSLNLSASISAANCA